MIKKWIGHKLTRHNVEVRGLIFGVTIVIKRAPRHTIRPDRGHGAVPYLTLHASESVAVARTPNLLNSARLHKVFQNFVVHGK